MSDPPDLDALARRYVSLWQEQLSGMAADPELSHNLGRILSSAAALGPMSLFGLWAGLTRGSGMPGAPPPGGPPAAPAGSQGHEPGPGTPATAPDSHGAAAAEPPPDDSGYDLGELHRRMAELEARILALEAGSRPSRPRAAKKSTKRKS